MGKRVNNLGLEHVEFILSFVLFVGFLAFSLYFFSPLRGDKIVDSTLYYAMSELSGNASVTVESLSVVINSDVLDLAVGIPVDGRQDKGILVHDSEGDVLLSYFNTGREIVFVQRGAERFIVINFGEEFDQGVLFEGARDLDEGEYSVSSSEINVFLSEKRLKEIAGEYNQGEEGYQRIKEDFNLPQRASFAFSLTFSEDDKIEAVREIPGGLEVFSDSKRYEILREDGRTDFADLQVMIW